VPHDVQLARVSWGEAEAAKASVGKVQNSKGQGAIWIYYPLDSDDSVVRRIMPAVFVLDDTALLPYRYASTPPRWAARGLHRPHRAATAVPSGERADQPQCWRRAGAPPDRRATGTHVLAPERGGLRSL
jgi:hypothetical protein